MNAIEHSEAHHPTFVEMSPDECLDLLTTAAVGRLGFVTEQQTPMVLPMTFVVDGGQIAMRTSAGLKLSVAERLSGSKVVFEVDEWDAEARTGASVVVSGELVPVLDSVRIAHLERVGHNTWADDHTKTRWLIVIPSSMSGKRITAEARD